MRKQNIQAKEVYYLSSVAPFFNAVKACQRHDPKHCRRRFRATLTKVALNQFRQILLTLQKVELLLFKVEIVLRCF